MMFRYRALPYLQKLSDGVIASRTVKTFGIGESAAEALLRDLMNALHNPTLAPYAKEGEVELRITAKAPVEAQARDLIAPVEAELRALLGDVVYGADVPSIQAVAFALLEAQGLTLGAAESCTGGLVAKCITDLPGASGVFKGGVVSYTNEVKHGVLGVPRELLDQFGAVSPQVAEAMAEGACRAAQADFGVSTTGLAGPDGDGSGKPVGLVYVGCAGPKGVTHRELYLTGSRDEIRQQACREALALLESRLEK